MKRKNESGLTDGALITIGLVLVVVLPLVIWGLSVVLAPLFGAGNAYKKTNTADYRIANYDLFKDNCNSILATEQKIVLAQQTLDSDKEDGVDSGTLRRDKQNLLALQNSRVEQIGEYNADATKSQTRGKFRDAGLPTNINPNGEIGAFTCP